METMNHSLSDSTTLATLRLPIGGLPSLVEAKKSLAWWVKVEARKSTVRGQQRVATLRAQITAMEVVA